MTNELMTLKILLPFQIFEERSDVKRVVVETPYGSYGLLPQRLDCTASLSAGILTYECIEGGEVYTAIDEGILVKAGKHISIAVRNAIRGTNLAHLREVVESEILDLDERERNVRSVLAKLESSFIRRLMELRHA